MLFKPPLARFTLNPQRPDAVPELPPGILCIANLIKKLSWRVRTGEQAAFSISASDVRRGHQLLCPASMYLWS